MKIGHIIVLCVAIFFAIRLGWLAIEVAVKQIQTRDIGDIEMLSHTQIKVLRGKIDDSDCSITLAVAAKDTTDQDFIKLIAKVENGYRIAVAYVFDSEKNAVYPKTAIGGFVSNKVMSHIVGTVICNPDGQCEVVRYEPNMATGTPRIVFSKQSR